MSEVDLKVTIDFSEYQQLQNIAFMFKKLVEDNQRLTKAYYEAHIIALERMVEDLRSRGEK